MAAFAHEYHERAPATRGRVSQRPRTPDAPRLPVADRTPAGQILALQRLAGNAAVSAALAHAMPDPLAVQRNYLTDVAGSLGAYLSALFVDFPQHVWRLAKHVLVGLPVTVYDLGAEVVRAVAAGFAGDWGGLAGHLGKALQAGAAWPARLVAKIFDLVAFGEFMDLVMQIVKVNTRSLTGAERAAATLVYGNQIDLDQVRVDEHSLLNEHVFHWWIAFTSWHTINFPPGGSFTTDPGTFVHEMCHVWQMGRRGTQYIVEAPIHGGLTGAGYVYAVDRNFANNANEAALAAAANAGQTIWDYGLEQQAEICNHYYMRLNAGLNVAGYQPFINDIQGVRRMPLRAWLREPVFLP